MARTGHGRAVRSGVFGRRVGAAVAALALWGALSAQAAAQNEGGIPEAFRDAEHLLTVLETGDEGIRTLRAAVELINEYGPLEGNEKQKRQGTLYFSTGNLAEQPGPGEPAGRVEGEVEGEGAPGERRAFRVDFVRLYLPSGEEGVWVRHEEKKNYIFDGRVLLELSPDRKFAIRRIVAGPEEEVDPLALGEGPFPIPIGQQKEEILKRFDAELLGPEAGLGGEGVPPMLEGTVQLRLTPKPGAAEAEDFHEVRIWYTRHDAAGNGAADFLLPVKARTVDPDGSKADVNLANVAVNADLEEGLFETTAPEGWEVQREDLRREAGGDLE